MSFLLRLQRSVYFWPAVLVVLAVGLRLTATSAHFCTSKLRHLSEREIIDAALEEEAKGGLMQDPAPRRLYDVDPSCCRVERSDADWLDLLFFQNYYFVTIRFETNERTRAELKYKQYGAMVSVSSCGVALENTGSPIN